MEENELKTLHGLFHQFYKSELALAELYSICGKTYKHNHEFWQGLEQQERMHAQRLVKMAEIIAEDHQNFSFGRSFREASIIYFMDQVNQLASSVSGGEMAEIEALQQSRDFESSIIERKFGDVVKTRNTEYRQHLQEILGETEEHLERITTELKKLHQQS